MKTVLSVAFLVVALCLVCDAVEVKEGDFSFTLESVRILQQLAEQPKTQNPRLAKTSYYSVCSNPSLPQEFVPLCMQRGATMSFARLASVPVDVCEICAFAACTGC
ncbi:guanylin family protein precursor [Danio rerio]|uniref:Guanylate cyclase activator 2B n=1 Tax=Danio rerio TaxID=7955 RepID=A0A0K0WSU6_DANRE|nr:guanylin family protein precursor [Danio rerio]XP_056324279.1 guanylin family protein [Danio aesculapii]AKS25895.1 Odc1 [Danio rerio]|eukprot:NP_001298140.1 guanylate cyclase activator 2B (uroguanylin) precursor [Danio rerio]